MLQISANTAHQSELGNEKGGKVVQNVAAGVAGLIVWPLWFAMDFQGAADTESKALELRDPGSLSTLALQRCSMQPMVGNSVGMPIAAGR